MKLLVLLTLLVSIAAAIINEISTTSPNWPSQAELVKLLEQENLPYDIESNRLNLKEVIPYCRPTTVTRRRGITYTKTIQLPLTITDTKTVTQSVQGNEAQPTVTKTVTHRVRVMASATPSAVTVTNTKTVTHRVRVRASAAPPAVTITDRSTMTEKHTVTSIVTRYQTPPNTFGGQPIKASRKVKTEEGDDTCIYVGDVTGGYDVLSITADLIAQVLHTMQYYIDMAKGSDLIEAGAAEAFIAGVKLTLHIKNIGCGLADNSDPIIGFPGNQDGDIKASQDALKKILDFDPFNKNNPLTQLVDTTLDILKQLGITEFEEMRPLFKGGDLIKNALLKAGLPIGPIPIESKGDRELREVLHLVGLPGLANFKGLFHRFFKAAGENNFSDNIESLIDDFKHTPYKGTIAKMDTTNFMDYEETKNLQPSFNSSMIAASTEGLVKKDAKEHYNKLLRDIAGSVLHMNKTLDDLIPPFVNLYFQLNGGEDRDLK
ncbi:hypothetical protein K501DRAFT_308069 [Backusella circina FSU 941]|nr:hypothetical protein K501DRAFT_308069 [Backusella circina FSU 941]